MTPRRSVIAAIPAVAASTLLAPGARAAPEDFQRFLAAVRAEARRKGISPYTLDRAFAGVQVNQKVLEKLHHPAEFTMTWAQYRDMLLTDQRIAQGREAYRRHAPLFQAVAARFGVAPAIVLGIWGLESSYGAKTGDYHVIEALATCAWDSSRRAFFRGELLAALEIIDSGDVTPAHMTGSYAGAMGQPQFMPTSYVRYAVDFEGSGRRDIWTSTPDVLASIANYLARNGWQPGEPWGFQVAVPPGLRSFGRDDRQSLSEWGREGVRMLDGRPVSGQREAGLVQPDGPGGDAFLVFGNFAAIRRYNPSDFYALLTGLLGDSVLA